MRTVSILFLITVIGCSTTTRPLIFDIRSADVVSASAEPLEPSRASGDFKAQIHIIFQEQAAQRFRDFMGTHAGQLFELQVNGEVLLPAVSAQPAGGWEVSWYASSLEEAQHFATSLNKK